VNTIDNKFFWLDPQIDDKEELKKVLNRNFWCIQFLKSLEELLKMEEMKENRLNYICICVDIIILCQLFQ
jgi:hypothetical protein